MEDPNIVGGTVRWGVGVSGLTGTTIATFNPQRATIRKEQKRKESTDGSGITKTVVFYDTVTRLTLEVIPTGTSSYDIPTPGTVVTVADSTDSQIAGKYLVESASKEESSEGETRITLELVQYGGITLT